MTLEEKVICETYTGICFTSSEERSEVYRYAEKLMGRPVYTHDFPRLADQLKERSRADFIKVCKGELAAHVAPMQHGKWKQPVIGKYGCVCSICGAQTDNDFNYCPNCGVKMDGGASHE